MQQLIIELIKFFNQKNYYFILLRVGKELMTKDKVDGKFMRGQGVAGWRGIRKGVGCIGRGIQEERKRDLRRRIGGKWRSFGASGLVAGILGSGARESNFLELGRWRGSVPSWMGGNSFRHVVLGKQLQQDNLLLQDVFHCYYSLLLFTVNC
jgi:hypothetical protein